MSRGGLTKSIVLLLPSLWLTCRHEADVLSAVANQLSPANVTMQYPATGNPVFLKWQPRPEYTEDKASRVILIWGLIFGLCWLPIIGLFILLVNDG